jgi:hypothetical protein
MNALRRRHLFQKGELVVFRNEVYIVDLLCGGAEDPWGFWYHVSNHREVISVSELALKPYVQAEWDREAV